MGKTLEKIKDENKILIMLAFFSMSIGLWDNFKQLWMQDNGLPVPVISQILSIATFLCAICILFFAKKIEVTKIQRFLLGAFLIKAVNLLLLYILNQTNNRILIEILVITDVIIEKLITLSIYPFIVTVKKKIHYIVREN